MNKYRLWFSILCWQILLTSIGCIGLSIEYSVIVYTGLILFVPTSTSILGIYAANKKNIIYLGYCAWGLIILLVISCTGAIILAMYGYMFDYDYFYLEIVLVAYIGVFAGAYYSNTKFGNKLRNSHTNQEHFLQ